MFLFPPGSGSASSVRVLILETFHNADPKTSHLFPRCVWDWTGAAAGQPVLLLPVPPTLYQPLQQPPLRPAGRSGRLPGPGRDPSLGQQNNHQGRAAPHLAGSATDHQPQSGIKSNPPA